MLTHPSAHYVRILRPQLPPEAFAPDGSRLKWMALHIALAGAGMAVVLSGWGGWPVALAMSVVIGHSFTGAAFVGHEMLHGSVVRGRRASHVLGWVCLLPFTLSPTLWKAWHNRVHHGSTMVAGVDPDAYPTLDEYRTNWRARAMERFSVARGHLLAVVCLMVGFTIQSTQLLAFARAKGHLSRAAHRQALLETAAGVLLWAAVAAAVGVRAFLFVYVLPLLAANALAMAYILTNHNLSPMTAVNDPLLNSLTVTVPPFWAALHSSFGLHVEHHLFPAVSSRHLPEVRERLVELWPDRYQSMPLSEAFLRLARTPRIYREPTVLFDPRTGDEVPTLLPRDRPSAKPGAALLANVVGG